MKTFKLTLVISIVVICSAALGYLAYISYSPTSLLGIGDRVVMWLMGVTMFAGIGFMCYSLGED